MRSEARNEQVNSYCEYSGRANLWFYERMSCEWLHAGIAGYTTPGFRGALIHF